MFQMPQLRTFSVHHNLPFDLSDNLNALLPQFKPFSDNPEELASQLLNKYPLADKSLSEVRALGLEFAQWCYEAINNEEDEDKAYKRVLKLYESIQDYILMPSIKTTKKWLGATQRLQDGTWWARKLRPASRQHIEMIAYSLGYVSKNRQHTSFQTIQSFRNAKQASKKWIEKSSISNGQIFIPLEKVMFTPAQRKAEIYCHLKGLQDIAEAQEKDKDLKGNEKLTWCFLTMTLPGVYHINPKSGAKNWDSSSPKEQQEKLVEWWARLRSTCAKKGLKLWGMRVVEAHIDGTVHWHALVYLKHNQVATLYDQFRRIWKNKNAGDITVGKKGVVNNKEPAAAASYVMKYLMKDFKYQNYEDAKPDDISHSAWKELWQLRAYQFFGMRATASVWRLMRRFNTEKADLNHSLIQLAKGNESALFSDAIKKHNVELIKSENTNKYGEKTYKNTGFTIDGITYDCSTGEWMIVDTQSCVSSSVDTVRYKLSKRNALNRAFLNNLGGKSNGKLVNPPDLP